MMAKMVKVMLVKRGIIKNRIMLYFFYSFDKNLLYFKKE